jgi:ATP-dependent DNA helicase RecG
VHILDRKDFTGGIVSDIEDSLRFIERNTRTAYRIEGLRREDVPEYPMKALREAITNAVMHRDWFMEGANVFVEIYTDRIEISSPGGLPKGMKFSDLGRKSIRRNTLIADLLHRITFIEKAGTGIKRMREEAREQRCPAPIFEDNGFFTAIFYPNPEVRAQVGTTEEPKTAKSGTKLALSKHHDEHHDEAHDEAHDKAHEPLSIVEHRLLKECTDEPQSTPNLLHTLGYKTRSGGFKVALSRLLALGFLEMTIPDKPRSKKQRYRTTATGRAILEKHEKETKA